MGFKTILYMHKTYFDPVHPTLPSFAVCSLMPNPFLFSVAFYLHLSLSLLKISYFIVGNINKDKNIFNDEKINENTT
jgi:hypothetical protein